MLEYYALGATVLSAALIWATRKYGKQIEMFRKKIRTAKELLEEIEKAMKDNKITEEELRDIVRQTKKLLSDDR